MAEAEVTTVSMGDLVVMKANEEEDGDDEDSKTQVILQLQPITVGMDESGNAAVVGQSEDTSADGEEVELGYPITCGESKAVLLVKKFVCPGINVKCVKYEDQLISPKQFVHMSGKATLKDWKRAIRMGGVMLRKMMDSGQLDFYEHTSLCTNTCRSTKFDLLISNTRFPPDGSGLITPTSSQAQVVTGNGSQVDVTTEERSEVLSRAVDWGSEIMETSEKKETSEISEETLSFWKGIADVGLMGEVVENIRTELLEMLRGVQLRSEQAEIQDSDSCLVEVAVLSNLAQVFGLLDSVKRILTVRREQTDPAEEQLLSTLNDLELQLEEQRRQQEARAQLNQPQPCNNISHAPAKPVKPKPKRPRLQRPASTALLTSTQHQTATLQPQQFTVLSPISFSSMGQPFSFSGLPVATLGQQNNTVTLHTLPAGAQTFTRYITTMVGADGKTETLTLHPSQGLTLVGTTLQDPNQLGGTMMSPMELVQFTQGGVTVGGEMMVEQPVDGQVVEGETMVLHQEGMTHEGGGDEGQGHATVIEIDPAPGDQDQTMGAVMELQLAQEGEDEVGDDISAVVVHGSMEVTMGSEGTEGDSGKAMEVQGEGDSEDGQGGVLEAGHQIDGEGVQTLQLDASGQISGIRIIMIEESQEDSAK